jgi:hypothetical protein
MDVMRTALVLMVSIAVPGVVVAAPPEEAARAGEVGAMGAAQTDQVAITLEQAHTAARAGDASTATRKMRAAANELRREAAMATGADAQTLSHAADDLEEAADATGRGQGRVTTETNNRIARAEHDLAQYHLDHARKSWATEAAERTGRELRMATHHVENAARWAGIKGEQSARDVLDGASRVSSQMIEHGNYAKNDVGRALDDLGGVIDRLGKKVAH